MNKAGNRFLMASVLPLLLFDSDSLPLLLLLLLVTIPLVDALNDFDDDPDPVGVGIGIEILLLIGDGTLEGLKALRLPDTDCDRIELGLGLVKLP